MITPSRHFVLLATVLAVLLSASAARATPANKSALRKHYGKFLAEELNRCATCHLPSEKKNPESLEEFPHNPFGARLRLLGDSLTIAQRLNRVRDEDADQDGVANEDEILLASNPGDASSQPAAAERERLAGKRAEFEAFLASHRWEPFEPVKRPSLPRPRNSGWARNEIDLFVAAEHEKRGLKPRPEASREVLMRRAYLDLVGLNPTVEEQRAFLSDTRGDAFERLIERLLDDPRYGERWGRHWMDIWRYSDWAGWSGGNQIRDSKPHIWRWRDWIIESLNGDKGYDRMVLEMLAADELAPRDTNALRATGFLVRNYKMLSREQWLEDTVKHTSQAFLGVTIGCAKCHDHMTDPISQAEYYQLRAVFEPHQVRTDRVPGELDTGKNGLVRVYDAGTNAPTYFFIRGDERKPDTNRVMSPGVPKALRAGAPNIRADEVELPLAAAYPDRREFVIREQVAAAGRAVQEAQAELAAATVEQQWQAELALAVAETKEEILVGQLRWEEAEAQPEGCGYVGRGTQPEGCGYEGRGARAEGCGYLGNEVTNIVAGLQKKLGVLQAELKVAQALAAEAKALSEKKDADAAKRKREEAGKALAQAQKVFENDAKFEVKGRPQEIYPERSTGRRLAFARWIASDENPLAARVAMNHVWLRRFGRGLVTTPENFGASGNPPSHPELLDWLAAEFMARGWSMKALHRLMLGSSTYRMASTPDETNLQIDPDNVFLWRMPSRRIEAELVRDNLLHAAGDLDASMGGPDIDHLAGLTSKRRSVYLRLAAEKEVEFLKIFDGPDVTECYQRRPTVMPQQALALGNSKIAVAQARSLAAKLAAQAGGEQFIGALFARLLARTPTSEERAACTEFLESHQDAVRARENLALVLLNHNDFVTVR